MMSLIMVLHVVICILLIGIILIQAGRGGGLVESFSGVESMFGPKTNTFLARTTTILAILFFLTCVALALLSARQSRSLMKNIPAQTAPAQGASQEQGTPEVPPQPQNAQEAPKAE